MDNTPSSAAGAGAVAASAGPASDHVDIYADTLKKLQACSATLYGWRHKFGNLSAPVAQKIVDTVGQFAAAGAVPALDVQTVTDALYQRGSISFDPAMLNDFAGYSMGPGPTGALVYKSWDSVVQQGPWSLQKATQSNTAFVRPADIAGSDADHQLNVYSEDTGLVAFHTGTYGPGPKQNLLFNFYPLGSARILWVGQTIDDQLQPNAGNVFTIAVNYRSNSGGQRAFLLVLFELSLDADGGATVIGGPPPVAFIADAPPFLKMQQRIAAFRTSLLGGWRTSFQNADSKLAQAIADAFNAERQVLQRQAFPAPPVSADEIHDAFSALGQRYTFHLEELNQFAGKWRATIYSYAGANPPFVFTQALNWGEFTVGADGYFQRVTGSGAPIEDSLLVYGDEAGLQSLVLDVYHPECGLASWLLGYGPDPSTAESGVIAYRLAADRTLWIAQFFTHDTVENAIKANQPLPASDVYNLTLEWIVPAGAGRHRYLVSLFFTIDFAAGTLAALPAQPVMKVKSFTGTEISR